MMKTNLQRKKKEKMSVQRKCKLHATTNKEQSAGYLRIRLMNVKIVGYHYA